MNHSVHVAYVLLPGTNQPPTFCLGPRGHLGLWLLDKLTPLFETHGATPEDLRCDDPFGVESHFRALAERLGATEAIVFGVTRPECT